MNPGECLRLPSCTTYSSMRECILQAHFAGTHDLLMSLTQVKHDGRNFLLRSLPFSFASYFDLECLSRNKGSIGKQRVWKKHLLHFLAHWLVCDIVCCSKIIKRTLFTINRNIQRNIYVSQALGLPSKTYLNQLWHNSSDLQLQPQPSNLLYETILCISYFSVTTYNASHKAYSSPLHTRTQPEALCRSEVTIILQRSPGKVPSGNPNTSHGKSYGEGKQELTTLSENMPEVTMGGKIFWKKRSWAIS